MLKLFAAGTVWALATLVVLSSAARADTGYQPYYMQAADDHQFATIEPPMVNGYQPPPQPPAPVEAQRTPSVFYGYNNAVWGAAGSQMFDYKQSTAPVANGESGWMPSLAGGIDFMTQDNLYLGFTVDSAFGTTHYSGTPAAGTTSETVTSLSGQAGQGFLLAENVMLIPYVEGGYRYWDRNLGGGQVNDYSSFDALGGLRLEVAPTDRLMLSAYASGGTTIDSRMRSGGNSYQLGSTGMEKVGGKIGFDLTPKVELFGTVDYDHFRYDHSPVVNATSEPGSGTNETTFRVGVGYHFR